MSSRAFGQLYMQVLMELARKSPTGLVRHEDIIAEMLKRSEEFRKEYEASKAMEQAVQDFVSEIASDFGVSEPPKVEIYPREITWHVCGELAAACQRDKVITFAKEDFGPGKLLFLALDTVLHEFAHYLQLARAGFDEQKVFATEEFFKPHYQRKHEIEADEFAHQHLDAYKSLWRRKTLDVLRKYGTRLR